MNTTVLGWYDHGNIGDEAYKIAFPMIFPDHKFTFTDVIPNGCERVFLGGGDVLQRYFLDQLKKCNVPKYAMSVNVKCSNIPQYVDIFKQLFIRNLCTTNEKVLSIPDFAFALEPNVKRGNEIIGRLFGETKSELYERVVIVVMNAYLMFGESVLARDHIAFDKVCFDFAKVMDNTNASFLFLPFGNGFPHNDRLANSALYSRCKFWKKNCMCYSELSVQDTLDTIAAADMLIGTRLHASIFACVGGTPFIDLTHHDKTSLFLESINKDWGVNYWQFNTDRLKSLISSHMGNDEYKEDLLRIARNNRSLLLQLPTRLKL